MGLAVISCAVEKRSSAPWGSKSKRRRGVTAKSTSSRLSSKPDGIDTRFISSGLCIKAACGGLPGPGAPACRALTIPSTETLFEAFFNLVVETTDSSIETPDMVVGRGGLCPQNSPLALILSSALMRTSNPASVILERLAFPEAEFSTTAPYFQQDARKGGRALQRCYHGFFQWGYLCGKEGRD